jgi:hypothetical protein
MASDELGYALILLIGCALLLQAAGFFIFGRPSSE